MDADKSADCLAVERVTLRDMGMTESICSIDDPLTSF